MIGKRIYALDCDKHNPNGYGYMGTITNIENGLVYIHSPNNPLNYQNYTIELNKVKKWLKEKLYKLN